MTSLAILVVDREASAEALAAVLRRRGHRVRTAPRASALEDGPTDVLVLAFEHEDDLGVVRRLRERGKSTRVIAVGAAGEAQACRDAFRAGADDYLFKPVRSQELLRAVEREPLRPAPDATVFSQPPEQLALELLSVAESIEEAARASTAFALAHGLGPATRARLASAIAECVENACNHAYPSEPGPIRLRLAIRGNEACAVVEDDGTGFDVADIASDCFESPLHNGLARVACLTEDLDLDSRPAEGTRATLRFSLYRVALGDAGDLDLSEHDYLSPEDAREVLHKVQALDRGDELVLSPALAVVLGRLLAGPDLRRRVELALRS